MTELFIDNLIPTFSLNDILKNKTELGENISKVKQTGDTIINPTILGGVMEGISFRSSNTGARIEIFPEFDQTIGQVVYNAAGSEVLKILIEGTDTGDITIGNYAGGQGAKWDNSAGTFSILGTLTALEIHIPNENTTANSFHSDADGNSWWGCTHTSFDADNNNALAYVLKTGIAKFQNVTLDGAQIIIKSTDPSSFTDVEIGCRTITCTASDDIQTAINLLGSDGGIIFLKAGTYVLTADITGISKLQIVGENESSTIITANGGAYSLDFSGTLISSAGTLASITSTVNVTGTGTTWTADGVTAYRDSIFIGTRWYTIKTVTDNTHLVLLEAFTDDVALGTYRISTLKTDIDIKNITVQASIADGILIKDCRNIVMSNIILASNSIGLNIENASILSLDNFQIFGSTNEGAKFTNVGLCNIRSFLTANNGTNGITINNVKIFTTGACASEGNTGDGINISNSTQVLINHSLQGNGSNGIEVVSVCSKLFIESSIISGNTSDGIKFTATADNCIISNNQITGNGGYGLNIAASTCDNNIVLGNQFASNTSGDVNNSGTGTLFNTNIPHQEPFHWFTSFESIDGYAKSAQGTGSIALPGTGDWVTIYSGNVTGNLSKIQKDIKTNNNQLLSFASKPKIWKTEVGFQNPVANTEVRVGMGVLEVITNNHIGFKFTNAVVYGTVADGTTETELDLGYTISTNSLTELKFVFTPGKNVEFYVQGLYKGEITTNLPSTSDYSYKVFYASLKSTSDAAREFWVSYVDLWQSAY